LPANYFGDGVEILERKVNGRTIRVEWDWEGFEDTKGFLVDETL